jgi:hypothetical protein
MNHTVLIVLIVAVVILAAAAAYSYSRERRSRLLREHFGPEYDRVVGQQKSVRKAEGVLQFREKARETLEIRPLSHDDQASFATEWTAVQQRFVDDPARAVLRADQLVSQVMEARGYPVASFEQRAEIVSVDHPMVVQNYRIAHEISLRHEKGGASTEDLRKAMVHYRSLFDELLEDTYTERTERKEARG